LVLTRQDLNGRKSVCFQKMRRGGRTYPVTLAVLVQRACAIVSMLTLYIFIHFLLTLCFIVSLPSTGRLFTNCIYVLTAGRKSWWRAGAPVDIDQGIIIIIITRLL